VEVSVWLRPKSASNAEALLPETAEIMASSFWIASLLGLT
jgi:hypothetical protein